MSKIINIENILFIVGLVILLIGIFDINLFHNIEIREHCILVLFSMIFLVLSKLIYSNNVII